MEATFPSNWKNLTIEKYGGTIDPNEHLDVLITQVSLYTTDDEILCQFATSRPHHLTFVALVNIQQEKREPLWTFMEHFRKVVMNI
ncbi:hypothetical protein JHK82_055345 [Glycine max]|nr:hypothetical protein JHK85_056160 [Glycine max]KAG5073974.1 hypothetical protein JHK84_055205 [Glycine max]KAG5076650.1 hypothetical protein JHK82_055345 [Glycine max]